MSRRTGSYVIYLRKSRADLEAEQRGEGETLARHEQALADLARRLHVTVTETYREIVSGETIAARPVMQRLLAEVEAGLWEGVLVMEVERLARGDTIDQGIVAQAFKFSGTKIITPSKTYDPENEFDEEYFEFGLFMSRREYKTINRRLQRGRTASVKEGKYAGSTPPFGYDRKKLDHDKGYTLVPNAEQAPVVKLIFQLYTQGERGADGTINRLGVSKIVRRLNAMKIPPQKGGVWSPASVRDMLKNPVYTGKLRWNWRKETKRRENGQVVVSRPRSEETPFVVSGLHEAVIDEETFRRAQEILSRNSAPSVREKGVVRNPLAGLVICGRCGKRMQRRPYLKKRLPASLLCPNTACDNASAELSLVESRILSALRQWLEDYRLTWNSEPRSADAETALRRQALARIEKEIAALEKQRGNLHDLLEQGVYDADTFLARGRTLAVRLREAEHGREALMNQLEETRRREESRRGILPKVEHLLDIYDALTPGAQNFLLREVLEKAVYRKDAGSRWTRPDEFTLDLYPRMPHAHPER